MDVLHELGVEAVPRSAAVAGVRTGAGDQNADDDRDDHEHAGEVGCEGIPAGYGAYARTGRGVDAHDEHRRERHEHDGGEVVQADHVGVEVREDGDPADHGLQRNVEADRQREPEKVGPLPPHPHDEEEHQDRHDHEHEGEQAVAELDHAMDAHLRRRDEGLRGAAGPGRAPSPDPVSRTRPPVPTIPICTTRVAHASAITRRSIVAGSRSHKRRLTPGSVVVGCADMLLIASW
nr:hypothetical protein GCM10025699_28410 [Microbacterium flavescens]